MAKVTVLLERLLMIILDIQSHSLATGKKLAVGAPNYDKVKNETSGKEVNDSGNVRVFELVF
jgi:hypothetical protein